MEPNYPPNRNKIKLIMLMKFSNCGLSSENGFRHFYKTTKPTIRYPKTFF